MAATTSSEQAAVVVAVVLLAGVATGGLGKFGVDKYYLSATDMGIWFAP